MRVNRQLRILSTILAGAATVLVGGCGNRQDDMPVRPASTTIGTEIDDTVITARVKSALFADPDIKSFDLKVETRKGEVQLSGFVDNQAQVSRANATTRGIEGVKSIDNKITLKGSHASIGNSVDDRIITTKVKSALLTGPNVKSFDIAVVTRKGEVQLSGFIDSQAQIDEAIAIARTVEGVTSVNNEMSIKK